MEWMAISVFYYHKHRSYKIIKLLPESSATQKSEVYLLRTELQFHRAAFFLIHFSRTRTSPYLASKSFLHFLPVNPLSISRPAGISLWMLLLSSHFPLGFWLLPYSFPSCKITLGPQDNLSISKPLTITYAESCLPYNKTHCQVPGISMQTCWLAHWKSKYIKWKLSILPFYHKLQSQSSVYSNLFTYFSLWEAI